MPNCPYCFETHTLVDCIEGIDYGVRFGIDHLNFIRYLKQGKVLLVDDLARCQEEFMTGLNVHLRSTTLIRVKLMHYGLGGNLSGNKADKIAAIMAKVRDMWTRADDSEVTAYRVRIPTHIAADVRLPGSSTLVVVDHCVLNPALNPALNSPRPVSVTDLEPARPGFMEPRPNNLSILGRLCAKPKIQVSCVAPLIRVKKDSDDKEEEGEDEPLCGVCWEPNPYMLTQCGHSFCSCITTHLLNYKKDSCPLCRVPITSLQIADERCYNSLKSVSTLLPSEFCF